MSVITSRNGWSSLVSVRERFERPWPALRRARQRSPTPTTFRPGLSRFVWLSSTTSTRRPAHHFRVRGCPGSTMRSSANSKRPVKWNALPFPRFAFHPDFSAHQFHQPRCDRESQTSPSVLARRGTVRLRERFEDHLLFVWRNSDAGVAARGNAGRIPLFVLQPAFRRSATHFASLRELHRVSHQVHQDLAQPADVALQMIRYAGSHAPGSSRSFRVRAKRQRLERFAEALFEVEIDVSRVQACRLRFSRSRECR